MNVTVTTPNGTSAVNAPSDQFTYNAPALPTVTGVSPTNGPAAGGTSVTVSGTNLTGATAVDFGTANPGTSITADTATSLTVTSPAGTGTVNVTVTTPNGTSAVNAPSDQYTYNAPALPTVTGVSPTNGPAAGGTSVIGERHQLDRRHGRRLRDREPGHRDHRGHRHQPHGHLPGGDRHGERHGDHPQRHLGRRAPSDQFTYNAPALPTVTGSAPRTDQRPEGPRSR